MPGSPVTTPKSAGARFLSLAWLVVPICACGFLVWVDRGRLRRVEYVTGLMAREWPVDVSDPRSPTGFANGQRELIVPEGNEDSFHWIEQTQQMLARGEARVRHVDYENAPAGREVKSTSPYRWWLGLLAWVGHLATGRPAGACVEWAALYADPALHLLMVLAAAALVWWRFGGFCAALLSVGLVTLFPFSTRFLPGMPDQHGLAGALSLASILVLLAGWGELGAGGGKGRARPWFALAGVLGGLGMWVGAPGQAPITAGIIVGGLVESWLARRDATGDDGAEAPPWRTWAYCGGATVLAAYVAEYFPNEMGRWQMDTIHPLYGVAWIGAGELLARSIPRYRGGRPSWSARDWAAVLLGLAAIAGTAVANRYSGGPTLLSKDSEWARLTNIPGGAAEADTWTWLAQAGAYGSWATLLPLALVAPAVWLVMRRPVRSGPRGMLAIALGPVAVTVVFAWQRLNWWSGVDAALLALVVAAVGGNWRLGRFSAAWLFAAVVILSAVPGVLQLLPRGSAGQEVTLTSRESEQVIERHLARWLENRTGEHGFVVFAPPGATAALCYFGGLRGIGTFAADNRDGFGATLAIAAASTMEEVQGGIQAHGIRFIVFPSWDPFFDDFAHLYLAKKFADRTSLLVRALRSWNLPAWLRPVPYQLPVAGGFEGQSVRVFEVVDEQSPVAAASRLAEYFVETGELADAATAAEALRRFPGDVGALVARAQVQIARQEPEALEKTMASLMGRLSNGGDRYLPWDRRVSLVSVLVRANQIKQGHDELVLCLAEINEARLRSLSTGTLYELLVLVHAYGLEIAEPRLRDLTMGLLPDNLRSRL